MPDPENPIQQVVMTPEMLQNLISSMQTTGMSQLQQNVSNNSNFSACKHKFYGNKNEDIEAFIDAITVYKDCLKISDEHAVKGLSMLLHEAAATWWQGIKSSITTFDEALTSLRHAYDYPKPAYQIFKELFSREQGNEKTDIFISKSRALLSRLSGDSVVSEYVQLDMVYGLLNSRIREKLSRDKVNTFKELIEAARKIEQFLSEPAIIKTNQRTSQNVVVPKSDTNNLNNPNVNNRKIRIQCSFCKNYGHIKDECRKFASRKNNELTSNTNDTVQKDCSVANMSENSKIFCYGCKTPGYVKSNCPKCNKHLEVAQVTMSGEFLCTSMRNVDCQPYTNTHVRPLTHVNIQGHQGFSFLDSGAQSSVAGAMLRDILIKDKIPYSSKPMIMTLADGKASTVTTLSFQVKIVLQNREHSLTLIAVPEHVQSRTLLGSDFLKTANIILDVPRDCWYYGDAPETRYPFVPDPTSPSASQFNSIHLARIELREEEGTALTSFEKSNLNQLLGQNSEVFCPNQEPTPFAQHTIVLTDDNPIAVAPYRMSEVKKQQLKQEVDKLLEDGTIEECESPYAAPVVLVPKKDGGIRLTVDYRKLNAVTRADRYPLPRMDDLLYSTKETKFMSTLDLKSGYHQVAVHPDDRDKTAFICPFGIFRYTRMPFGLRNSPSTFQRLIDKFRTGLPDIYLLAYLDDLIIISPSFQAHLLDIEKVFARLKIFKLHLNRSKCTFCCSSVLYLGHVITPLGIKPDPSKVSAIVDRPPPKNVKQLTSFLQTCSWFRRFIEKFAEISKPLSSLLKKNVKWTWGQAQSQAFDQLKVLLCSSPILRQVDPHLPFLLRSDASSYALGACLLQGEYPEERPIEYASRLLTSAEQNYCTTELEALAIVWALNKFRGYVEGSPILVQSDHQPLKYLMSLKSPSGRLARWALALQAYDLKIDYTPGKLNVVADMLSRPPLENLEVHYVQADLPRESTSKIRKEQLADPDLKKIIDSFENPDHDNLEFKRWSERGYLMIQGVLFRYSPDVDSDEAQQVAPKSEIPRILSEYHDSALAGHYGIDRTYHRISSRYYWTGMRRTIADHISKCLDCQRYKASNLKPAGLLQTPVQAQRFETLSIDLFGPLPETSDGYKWIFVIEDTTSRWVEIFPLKTATAENCARCLVDEVILRYGLPRRVISDNAAQFVSSVMQQVAYCLGYKQSLIPVYWPAANPVERKNRDLKPQLAILTGAEHTSWKERIPAVRFAMNSVRSQSTGYSVAYLTFGRELRTPDDVQRDFRAIIENDNFVPEITPYLKNLSETLHMARENSESQQDRNKVYADRVRRDCVTYKIDDKVLVNVHALSKSKDSFTTKFAPRRDGPYVVTKVVTPTTYEVSSLQNPDVPLGKYHVSALTPFQANTSEDPSPVVPLRKRGRPAKPSTEVSRDPEFIESPDPPEDADSTVSAASPPIPEAEDSSEVPRRRRVTRPRCSCCT